MFFVLKSKQTRGADLKDSQVEVLVMNELVGESSLSPCMRLSLSGNYQPDL